VESASDGRRLQESHSTHGKLHEPVLQTRGEANGKKIYDEDQQKFKRLTGSIREFGVELNDPYCENERHRRIQEMKPLLLEHIYEKTKEILELN
jgi:hypothetical protein